MYAKQTHPTRKARAAVRYREDTPGELLRARVAVAAWRDASERGDVELMRRMIRSAFPDLAVAMPSGRGDHNPTRMLWAGSPTLG